MTESKVELLRQAVRDLTVQMHMLLQKQHHRKEETHHPPKHQPVWVCLPVRINLRLQPGNMLLSSVELRLPLSLTSQDVHRLEITATRYQLSKETALIELLKTALRIHKKMQEIIRQGQQRYPRQQVVIDVELLGEITWEELRTHG